LLCKVNPTVFDALGGPVIMLVSVKFRWLVVAAYPALGLLLGLADSLLGRLAQQLGTRPGVATAVSVNLLLPLAAVALGIAYPRVGSVLLGAVSMTFGLVVGLAVNYHGGKEWSPIAVLTAIPPVLVAAAIGYAVLGTMAALVTMRYERV
jgi:hypothetical protein